MALPFKIFVTYTDGTAPDPDPTPTPTPDPTPDEPIIIPEGAGLKIVIKDNLKSFFSGIEKIFAKNTDVNAQFQSVNTQLNGKVDLTTSKHIKLPDGTEIWVE